MKCPVCNTYDLVMSERQGIEIDYCPNCRGVWLDRGELDKIIEKAVASEVNTGSGNTQQYYSKPKGDRHYDSDDYRKHHKKHWLNDLFD